MYTNYSVFISGQLQSKKFMEQTFGERIIITKLSQIFSISESELNVSMISDQIADQVVKRYNQQAGQILKSNK